MKAVISFHLVFGAIQIAECRVYCQDVHATRLMNFGYSCPVSCENVITAIENLKLSDYKRILQQNGEVKSFLSGTDYLSNSQETARRNLQARYKINHTSFKNQMARAIHLELKNLRLKYAKLNQDSSGIQKPESSPKLSETTKSATPFGKPDWLLKDNDLEKVLGIKSSKKKARHDAEESWKIQKEVYLNKLLEEKRKAELSVEERNVINDSIFLDKEIQREIERLSEVRSSYGTHSRLSEKMNQNRLKRNRDEYEVEIMQIFTKVFNHYSGLGFTIEMMSMLLESILGRGLELRHGIADISRAVDSLNRVIVTERRVVVDTALRLRSQNCLSVRVPGCYCVPGYVEMSGECVDPKDCVRDETNRKYLSRIIIE